MASQSPESRNSHLSDTASAASARRHWLRRLRWVFLIFAALLLLARYLVPRLGAPFLRTRLQQMVASKLNAELRIDHFSYTFPYELHLYGAALRANDPDNQPVELLRVGHLEIALARHPFHSGP